MASRKIVLLLALVVVALYATLLGVLRFHLCLNDFWAWSLFASRIEFGDIASLYNGFMPPAYAMFLRSAGPGGEIAAAFTLTLLSVFVGVFTACSVAREVGVRGSVAMGGVLLALYPPFLQSGLTAGPDIVVAALVSVAVSLHWTGSRSIRLSVLAGLFLGVAVLVRGHALLAGLALLAAPALVDRRVCGVDLALGAGLSAGVLIQIGINLAANEAAWSSSQPFNVYKMVYGMNWFEPTRPESISIPAIVAERPWQFFREWVGAGLRAGAWLIGPALAWAHARRHGLARLHRFSVLATIAGVLYVVPVSLGDSPRAIVVVSILVVVPVAGFLADLRRRPVETAAVAMAAVVAFGLVSGLQADRAFWKHNLAQSRDFADVERRLEELGVDSAREVFTDDFDLYFRRIADARPLTKGGWGLIGIEGWEERFPQVATGSIPGFLESCRFHGVRYLALTRRSRKLGPDFPHLHEDPASAGLVSAGEFGEFRIFAVPEEP